MHWDCKRSGARFKSLKADCTDFKTFRDNCNNTVQVIGLQEFQLASRFVNHCFYTVYVQSTIIQCYKGRLTNCVFWMQGGGGGGGGGLQLDALKNQQKNRFLTKQIFEIEPFFSAFKSPNGL